MFHLMSAPIFKKMPGMSIRIILCSGYSAFGTEIEKLPDRTCQMPPNEGRLARNGELKKNGPRFYNPVICFIFIEAIITTVGATVGFRITG
jgi:hypothetical protein